MGMGNSKSKKTHKEPEKFFERERWKEQKRDEKIKKNLNPKNKRTAAKEAPLPMFVGALPAAAGPVAPGPAPSPSHAHSYDAEALDRMRYQLHHDADAFLLNNILLSIQFFENYERETNHIKSNPISEREHLINEAMVRRHKHVFFADRLQECVHEHVTYQRGGQQEPLTPPRLFVIYDNVEASEPGDTSDYSAVLDAPFYKLQMEDCKEPGYVKLKKLEVLESTLPKDSKVSKITLSDDSVYTDSEKDDSDDSRYISKGKQLLQKIETKLKNNNMDVNSLDSTYTASNSVIEPTERRRSGPHRYYSSQVEKSNISNFENFKKTNLILPEESDDKEYKKEELSEANEVKPRKSILKTARRPSGPNKEIKVKTSLDIVSSIPEMTIAEDTETSGYRSNSSSRHNESSEAESDYGYTTITELTTPKKVELSENTKNCVASGVLPEECWHPVQIRAIDDWSDEDEDLDDNASKMSFSRRLYETFYYLSSLKFMNNFVDNFIINLGSGLGLTQDAINNALTQGASIYFDTIKNGTKMNCEVFPALIASWPDVANQWIIRERRIIQNPRTNFSYQWPTKYMVNKAIGFGCLLVPIGFRPKRGLNPDQMLQWRVIFPAAERYLESCLAHSHVRCYLFALVLHKTFMENNTSKIGIDASHIKNHLFWQCEDNYAKWPEDRLGETLRIFLRSFYIYFAQDRFPNYFIETCNDFKSIPKPLLRRNQKCLADILESPVLHVLKALDKLKYTKKDFYPAFNCYRLYEILTCKNPLRILNPNLPVPLRNRGGSSDESEEDDTNFWTKARSFDKNYQWKKERQRQLQERRKAQLQMKKQKMIAKQENNYNTKIILPKKLDVERRRLVIEFFLTHFIAMARSSERYEAIRQAVIYLEQAQRLSVLLSEEIGGDVAAEDYFDVIRDKLADCQRKLASQGGFKVSRRESQMEKERPVQRPVHKQRPRFEHIMAQDSPTEVHNITPFTFVDVHAEQSKKDSMVMEDELGEESKL